jgi:hypothetical protein
VPIPTFPFCKTVNIDVPVDDAIERGFVPLLPVSDSDAPGVEDPIPIFPFARIEKSDAPVEDATESKSAVVVPWRLRSAVGVVVPIPTRVVLAATPV